MDQKRFEYGVFYIKCNKLREVEEFVKKLKESQEENQMRGAFLEVVGGDGCVKKELFQIFRYYRKVR